MQAANAKSYKTASIGKKIVFPILFMAFFQIIIFWLFIFQLGLFDSVVQQAQKNFFNNASNNANSLNSEMWFHFSNLASLSKPLNTLSREYSQSVDEHSAFTVSPDILTDMVLKSSSLHADGLYLELFQPSGAEVFHFRSNPEKMPRLVRQETVDFTKDILPLFPQYAQAPGDNPALRQFLNYLKERNQSSNTLTMYERGSWSPILNLDNANPSLLFAIPLNYHNTQYGFLASEIFLSTFENLLSHTSFPDSFPHQVILIRYNHLTGTYEIIAEKAFKMDALDPRLAADTLFQSRDILSYSSNSLLSEQAINHQKYFCSAHPLTYTSSEYIPFSKSSFYYITVSPKNVVMEEANLLIRTFIFLIVLFILVGIVIALFITKQVVFPITALTSAIGQKEFPQNFLSLPKTEISEIDVLTNTIITQNQNILNFHQTITDILMASDINLITFYTDTIHNITRGFGTFQALLGEDFANDSVLTFTDGKFEQLQQKIYQNFTLHSSYCNPFKDRSIQTDIYLDKQTNKYICVKTRELPHGRTIVMLDYTSSILEQEQIKKERDYDVLTSLFNRFSFTQKATEYLAAHPGEPVGMVMWDLDFLKTLNDTYGHDIGDLYLQTAGQILKELDPEKALAARVSGDEFFAFLFGYESKEELVAVIRETHQKLNEAYIILPNGEHYGMSASCGYVYSFGGNYEDLKKCADLAMYVSKKSVKGSIHEFNSPAI